MDSQSSKEITVNGHDCSKPVFDSDHVDQTKLLSSRIVLSLSFAHRWKESKELEERC
jgi:hypothetical protein